MSDKNLTEHLSSVSIARNNRDRMTSTSFNVGMNPESKLTSRVLKPPGGGHSDIFGVHDQKAESQHKNGNHQAPSNGNTEKSYGDVPADQNKYEPTEVPQPQEQKKPEPARAAEPAKRVRVPPGGFSSGLW